MPASPAIAVHTDNGRFILFDSEREAILGRIFTASQDTRLFPRDSMRDGGRKRQIPFFAAPEDIGPPMILYGVRRRS